MGKNNQSKKKNDPYEIGTVLFSAGSSKNNDDWDDSELIEHWEQNVEAFRKMCSNENEEAEEADSPFRHNLRKTNNGHISKKKPVARKTKQAALPKQEPAYHNNTQSNSQIPPSQCEDQPPQSSFLPPMPQLPTSQEELSNLIMAWYYCGYYTGIYQVKLE
ncbi:unnamed protein product [Mucor hiemalis]